MTEKRGHHPVIPFKDEIDLNCDHAPQPFEIQLGQEQRVVGEYLPRPDLGIYGVTGKLGVPTSASDLLTEAADNYNIAKDQIGPTGFTEIWRTKSGLPLAEAEAMELELAAKLVTGLITKACVNPDKIRNVFWASGAPIFHNHDNGNIKTYSELIAEKVGLSLPPSQLFDYSMACNSGGSALCAAALRAPLLTEDEYYIVGGMDQITKYLAAQSATKSIDKLIDLTSYMVFSNGFGILLMNAKSLQVHPAFVDRGFRPDRQGNLASIIPYESLFSDANLSLDNDGWLQQVSGKNMVIGKIPQPNDGQLINVRPRSAVMFLGAIEGPIELVTADFQKALGLKPSKAVPHPASQQVVNGLASRIPPETELNIGVTRGNSSGSTLLEQYLKNLRKIKRGEDAIFISYGAGMSWAVFIGRHGEAITIPDEAKLPYSPEELEARRRALF